MGGHAVLAVEPLVQPDDLRFVGVERDAEELRRRLLRQPVDVAVQRIEEHGAPAWFGLQPHHQTLPVGQQPRRGAPFSSRSSAPLMGTSLSPTGRFHAGHSRPPPRQQRH